MQEETACLAAARERVWKAVVTDLLGLDGIFTIRQEQTTALKVSSQLATSFGRKPRAVAKWLR